MNIFFTFILGTEVLHTNPYFASFLRSITGSEVKLLVIGTHRPSYSDRLWPTNVEYFQISWMDLISRIDTKLITNVSHLYENQTYHKKVCDIRPLFPLAYPELFHEAKWLGWLDNDMWFSFDIFHELTKITGPGYYSIRLGSECVFDDERNITIPTPVISWGPFFEINKASYCDIAYPLSLKNIRYILPMFENYNKMTKFDDWGWGWRDWGCMGPLYSMSNILTQSALPLHHLQHGLLYDNLCRRIVRCGYCRMEFFNRKTVLFDI